MNITLLSYGSRGDVEPFIALSKGLDRAGHHVRLAGPECFRQLWGGQELDYIGLPGDPQGMVDRLIGEARHSHLGMLRTMADFVLPLAEEVLGLVSTACQDAELIVHAFLMTSAGFEAARARGIPDISAQFFPVFATTSQFPAPTFPDLPLGAWYRRLTHELVSKVFWQGSRYLFKKIQQHSPGLPELSGWPFRSDAGRITPLLYAFSPSVIPRPADWPEHAHLTGYWFSGDQEKWSPDPRLADFLAQGPPPITIAFGSTSSRSLTGISGKLAQALALSGQRGVLVGADPQARDCSPGLLQTGYVPYSWLFQRSAAVIHHGGAGTTGQALAAGIPNIVLPFTSDQPFWARRVYQLGAGPRPISPRSFTSQGLASVIGSVLRDRDLQLKAREIGSAIRTEAGVSRAVELIESYADRQRRPH